MSDQVEEIENAGDADEAAGNEQDAEQPAAEEQVADAAEVPEAAEEAPAPEAAPAAEPQASQPAPQAAYSIPEPTSDLSRPAILNFESIFAPVSADNPGGEYLRYSGIYDEISEARRSDDDLAQGEWQHELKTADFGAVIQIATPALENESKDLQIAAFLSEALVHVHGFTGLRDSLQLLTGLQLIFWDALHPEIYEGDEEGRANSISHVDTEGSLAIQKAPITPSGYSYYDYLDSKKYGGDAEGDEEGGGAVPQMAVTAEKWAAEISQSKRAFYEELNVAIEECVDALSQMNLAIEEKFDIKQAPGTRALQKALSDIKAQTDKILEIKREEEPDEVESDETEGDSKGGGSKGGGSRAIENRADALRKLSELAAFFRRTEPHSPVSYLVSRAVKWGNMPLESWLQDVIKDENILYSLRQTLGFNTGDANEQPTDENVAQ